MKSLFALFVLFQLSFYANSRPDWDPEQQEIISAMDQLSKTTEPKTKDADAYADFLSQEFSRWGLGDEKIWYKTEWVEAIRDWLNSGWQVADRKNNVFEIRVEGDLAFVRRLVEESYLGPEGETSSSRSGLVEIWRKEDGKWRILRADLKTLN